MSDTIFLISHYNIRTKNNLNNLITQLKRYDCQIGVVINDDQCKKLLFENINNVFYIKRQNTGMNIGAWKEGAEFFDDFENYFFFQDECFVKDFDFLDKYLSFLSNKEYGIVGETINLKWARPWEDIKKSELNYLLKINDKKIDRVTYYMDQITRWQIAIGENASHLRALSFALKKEVLDKINGFNIGLFKEQCIASEIAISKKIEQIGLKVAQSNQNPFSYIGHLEWDNSGTSKIKT